MKYWTTSASDLGASCGFSCDAGLTALWRVSLCDSALLDSSIQQHRILWGRKGKEAASQKSPRAQKNKVTTICYSYCFFLTVLVFIFNSGSSLFSVPAGIKLRRLEEARPSFLTATMLHHFRQNLLFPPFTWAAAALSAAAGAAAVLLPALRPGLADSKLSRLHIAKGEELWSRGFFFYWFWKPRVAICDDFGVFCGGREGGERKGVNLG